EIGFSLLCGGVLSAVGKGAFKFKKFGPHSWSSTKSWMKDEGIHIIKEGKQARHHWLIGQNQGLGRYFSDRVKNQPWNINPISIGFDNWLSNRPALAWLGAPQWAMEVFAGGAAWPLGKVFGGGHGKGCDCD